MPLYDFRCPECDARFEAQVPYGQCPPCPECASADTERLLSPFVSFTIGLHGGDAKRSDATRAAREEQRSERMANLRARENRELGPKQ